MQDQNEDTEWNDILRAKGIIPEKPKENEITEDEIMAIMDKAIKDKSGVKDMEDMTLDELDELEDEEEERILEQYRAERMAQIRNIQAKSNYGDMREISADDYVAQVNNAGEGVWVVLHLYKQGIPLCALINQYLVAMAARFPTVKFLRSISTTCIPNYPDQNLPTCFVYFEGQLKASLAGPQHFRGMNMTADEFEFIISKTGAIQSEIKKDPKKKVKDVMMSSLRGNQDDSDDSSDNNDW